MEAPQGNQRREAATEPPLQQGNEREGDLRGEGQHECAETKNDGRGTKSECEAAPAGRRGHVKKGPPRPSDGRGAHAAVPDAGGALAPQDCPQARGSPYPDEGENAARDRDSDHTEGWKDKDKKRTENPIGVACRRRKPERKGKLPKPAYTER